LPGKASCARHDAAHSSSRFLTAFPTALMMRRPFGFIEPCQPSAAHKPPSGPGWIHEIKHDGYRMMAWRAGRRVRLFTRNGNDWSELFPAVVAAVKALDVRSCLIDALLLLPVGAVVQNFPCDRSQEGDAIRNRNTAESGARSADARAIGHRTAQGVRMRIRVLACKPHGGPSPALKRFAAGSWWMVAPCFSAASISQIGG
jgi:hypothetical protein